MASLDRPREPSPDDRDGVPLPPENVTRLGILNAAAQAHDLPVELISSDGGDTYYVRMDVGERGAVRVFCRPRPGHGDLWFYGDLGVAIAGAYDLSAALTWLWTQAHVLVPGEANNDEPDDGEPETDVPPLIIAASSEPRM
jgi:hypothetical protein